MLVGCIGGIGIFIARTGLEVASNAVLSLSMDGWKSFVDKFHLLALVFAFEGCLRLLTRMTKDGDGKSKFPLLSPVYFCSITPAFYAVSAVLDWLWDIGPPDEEYFFPPLATGCDASDAGGNCDDRDSSSTFIFWDDGVWDVFRVIDVSAISWTAVVRCVPTMVGLILFSLIHVPINIPAFAVSSNVDVDMNTELIAHGYSNCLAGVLGGKCLRNDEATLSSCVLYFSLHQMFPQNIPCLYLVVLLRLAKLHGIHSIDHVLQIRRWWKIIITSGGVCYDCVVLYWS